MATGGAERNDRSNWKPTTVGKNQGMQNRKRAGGVGWGGGACRSVRGAARRGGTVAGGAGQDGRAGDAGQDGRAGGTGRRDRGHDLLRAGGDHPGTGEEKNRTGGGSSARGRLRLELGQVWNSLFHTKVIQ